MQNVQHGLLTEIAGVQSQFFFFPPLLTMNLKKRVNLTEEPRNFIGLLLLNLLIIQSFKKDVQDQYVFSAEKTDKKTPKRFSFYFRPYHTRHRMVSHISCVAISPINVTLKVNDGDSGHAMPQYHPSTERSKGRRLTAPKIYLPDILLSFVEFLSQIFSRCLTGDLNHGQLLAIASHVAGGLTHTVIVVFLYQKVCG